MRAVLLSISLDTQSLPASRSLGICRDALLVVCCLKVPSRGTSFCADHVSALRRALACLVSPAPDEEVNSRPLPRPPRPCERVANEPITLQPASQF